MLHSVQCRLSWTEERTDLKVVGRVLREIAQVLEIPDGTVNSRMAEGLARLTELLEPQFGKKNAPAQRPAPRPINPSEILAL